MAKKMGIKGRRLRALFSALKKLSLQIDMLAKFYHKTFDNMSGMYIFATTCQKLGLVKETRHTKLYRWLNAVAFCFQCYTAYTTS
jgi:hypothetical protein